MQILQRRDPFNANPLERQDCSPLPFEEIYGCELRHISIMKGFSILVYVFRASWGGLE